jgi:hypothetical protein
MVKNYNIFPNSEPSPMLFDKILTRVDKERAKVFFVKAFWARSIAFLSFALTVFFVKALFTSFATTGFSQYFSLIFSDSKLVLTFWREFLLSLAESLPVWNFLVTLSVFAVFIGSLRYMFISLNVLKVDFKRKLS